VNLALEFFFGKDNTPTIASIPLALMCRTTGRVAFGRFLQQNRASFAAGIAFGQHRKVSALS